MAQCVIPFGCLSTAFRYANTYTSSGIRVASQNLGGFVIGGFGAAVKEVRPQPVGCAKALGRVGGHVPHGCLEGVVVGVRNWQLGMGSVSFGAMRLPR